MQGTGNSAPGTLAIVSICMSAAPAATLIRRMSIGYQPARSANNRRESPAAVRAPGTSG